MNEVIYKYEIDVLEHQIIEMPELATILTIQTQHGKGQIWARVNPSNKLVSRIFKTYPTGQELTSDTCCYLGTYQLGDGNIVLHVFEDHQDT